MFLRRNDNGSDGAPVFYDTRFELSIKENKRKMIDARGMTTEYRPPLAPISPSALGASPPEGEKQEVIFSLVDNPDSGKTWLLPDVAGKPSYRWDARGYRQRIEYDIAQRPIEKWVQAPNDTNEVLKQKTVYGETANSPRTENLLGQVFEQYDQAGKQSFVAYDFKGNLKNEARQFAQVFDAVLDYSGNVTLQSEIYSTSYAYDALDRPTSKTTPDHSTATYSYAKNAMLQSQSIEVRGSGSEEQAINDITYNAKGQRTDIYYANGSKTKYIYDLESFRIIRILSTRNNGQEILQDINYTFDAAGNITQQRDDAQQTIYFSNQVVQPLSKYTYDSLYRLKQATGRELNGLVQPSASDCPIQTPVPDTETNACRNYTLNYDYDELGNILQMQHLAQNGNWTRNYLYPSNSNKLIGHTSGQTDYTYDAAGNMLTMPHLNEMVWEENNMLVEVDLGGGGTAYYRYDSQGQRVRKVIVNGSVKKERLYINDFELWQQSTNGTIEIERETLSMSDKEKSFLRLETLTIDNSNTISTPFTKWRYQYENPLQNICLELDESASLISYEEYYPFGTTSYRSGKSESEVKLKRYRYNGKERDEETGFYYYGARYLAAWIGRFISVDPMAEEFPQLTPYNYAGNKPITHKDLEGLQGTGDDEETHTVKKGESLTQIAENSGNSVDDLVKWNNIDDPNKIFIGDKLKTYDPEKLKDRSSFESYPAVKESSGWLFGNANIQSMEVSNGVDLATASILNYDIANITGNLLEKVKSDPAMMDYQKDILDKIKANPDFGKKSFYLTGKKVVEFGGKRWSSKNEDWKEIGRNNPILHKETWDVAGDELTWALRHAGVKYWADVSSSGDISIEYRLYDTLDLSGSTGRSGAYNFISNTLGFGYHTVLGGNINLQTRAKWSMSK